MAFPFDFHVFARAAHEAVGHLGVGDREFEFVALQLGSARG